MRVNLAYSAAARQCKELEIDLESGCTVAQAIAFSGWLQSVEILAAQLGSGELACGIWGEKVSLDHVLRDGDRVEIYRALSVDPKEARRLRFAKQGTRAAGLFAKRRPGAKPGY